MIFSIPVYAEEHASRKREPKAWVVRPLFVSQPEERSPLLERAMTRLSKKVLIELRRLGAQPRHDELVPWTFCPELRSEQLHLTLPLHRQTVRSPFLVAWFKALDRKLATIANLPNVWFEILPGETVAEKATRVVSRYYRTLEKEEPEALKPELLPSWKRAWITTLDVSYDPPLIRKVDRNQQERFLSPCS